jgi:hypothetical protein
MKWAPVRCYMSGLAVSPVSCYWAGMKTAVVRPSCGNMEGRRVMRARQDKYPRDNQRATMPSTVLERGATECDGDVRTREAQSQIHGSSWGDRAGRRPVFR